MTRAEMRTRLAEIREYLVKSLGAIDALNRVLSPRGPDSDAARVRTRHERFVETIDAVITELST